MAEGKIEIVVLADGKYRVSGEFDGEFDSGSPLLTHDQVLERMPHLLTEMRMQVDVGRRLNPMEGKALHERFNQSSCEPDFLKDAPLGIQLIFGQPANMEWLLMVINATVAQREGEQHDAIGLELRRFKLI